MKAYKFRSSGQITHALDIIFNDRLYCADWRSLDDPMEGRFKYATAKSDQEDMKDVVGKIIQNKTSQRVCSLSRTVSHHLLWAHYASGFDGLAIEVSVKKSDVHPISYTAETLSVVPEASRAWEISQDVLRTKFKAWEYEDEVRILTIDEYFQLGSAPTKVIAGHRMNRVTLHMLRLVCQWKGIPVYRTDIKGNVIRLVPMQPPGEHGSVDPES